MVTWAFVSNAARVNAPPTQTVQLELLSFNSLVPIMANHHTGHHMYRLTDPEVRMIRFVRLPIQDPIIERRGSAF